MHESAIDRLCMNSPFRDLPPLGKLILSLVLITSALLATSPPVPLLVLIIGIVLLVTSSRFYTPRIFVIAYLDTFLIILIGALIIALLTPGGTVWNGTLGSISLVISREGVNLSVLVFLRALAGFTVLLFFASSTSIPNLFIALRQVGLPKNLSELAVLVYRYSFLLVEQVEQMVTAAQCRLGFHDLRSSLRTLSTIIACTFGRSMDFAERAQYALYCRNFQGNFPLLNPPSKLTIGWLFFPIAIFIFMLIFAYLTRTWMLI
jgi:cobalt/nickel transport system permease protein